jgi:4-carboxymuconolactone decarboxylase
MLYGSFMGVRTGEDRDELLSLIGKVCPDFLKVITEEHLFGEVWSRPGLDLRERCMITLAILIARRFGDETNAHMCDALNVGFSREEILEFILHTVNYTCWGAGVEAIRAGKDILGAG